MNDVTIIIKTFERPESLKKLLVSIRQFYPSIPVIVADDSKEPLAKDIVSSFANSEYIPLRFDVGLSAGRNVLLSRVKTKYFVLCDDDFIFDERTKLENFKKTLDDTDIELVGGYFHDITETGEFTKTHLYAGDLALDPSRRLRLVVLTPDRPFVRCEIVPNFFMAKTDAVRKKVRGWDPKLKVEEHTDFFWRAKQTGLKVAFTPDVSVNHTVARDTNYLRFRHARINKYHRRFLRKFRLRSFTDTWETITLEQVQPWFIKFIFEQKCIPWPVIEQWRKFYWRMDWEIKQGHPWLKEFIFKRKCMPWFVIHRWRKLYWRMDWEIKQGHPWLKGFVFKQKCIPNFIIQRWKDWKWNNAIQIKKTVSTLHKRGVVLMYHRVKDLDCDPWQLCVTPSRFEEHVKVIKKYGRPVQMREMGKNLKHFSFGEKEIVLTFDDGYADNLYNAKPILEHYEIPATFFIVSGAVGSREEYWWDELERFILIPSALPQLFELTIAGKEYRFPIISEAQGGLRSYGREEENIPQNNTALSKNQLYFTLWRILSLLSPDGKKITLRQIAEWAGQSSNPRPTHLPVTAKELMSLSRCPLFEIGAHTVYHPILANLTPQEQEDEITKSKRDLENMTGCGIDSFSYPHGCYNSETVKIVARQKFQAACTTELQPVTRNANPYLLPRFAVLNWPGDQFEKELQGWLAGVN